ncbi:MAG: MBL fold metallo-hydrolase [Pedosphaera sp. Tous-C6FEB]|nr:MAG: MBL fold metallo-hydrolase [Pedosphaera sp. Tous-C6FEB]
MYLLEINGQRLLLECGLYQGRRDESNERNRRFPFDPKSVDAAILSHAHIDHCGNLPNLCKQGFTGNIYSTFATRDLASIMLEDSARIQESDAQFVSKRRAKLGLPAVQPLYSPVDAERAVRQFVAINYDRPLPVADGVTVTFKDAGHILGSAQVVLDVREGTRKFRYLFSGDIGRPGQDILRDAQPVEHVDFLQIESTYGNRIHASPVDARDELASLVGDTLRDGGKVIIPAFSVGRTQQIVYALNQLTGAEKLPRVPIYVDSPLSTNATEIFRLHPECFDEQTYTFLRERGNPFGMANLTYIREVEGSRKLNELKEPAVIISASGMAEAGRVLHHLRNHGSDPANLILFVGYCAEHTLGAQIIAGRSPVNIYGEPHAIRARVAKIDAFSGHADRAELSAYVKSLSGHIKKTFVIHGEEESALAFGETLKQLLPKTEVTVPVLHQAVEV